MTEKNDCEKKRLILGGENAEDLEYKNLKILQKENGYRFTSDAVLLAGLAEAKAGDKVVDLGTGSGVIATLLSARTGAEVWGVEIQEGLADMARRSVRWNGIEEHVRVVCCDMREAHKILGAGTFDVAVSNPPYYPYRDEVTLVSTCGASETERPETIFHADFPKTCDFAAENSEAFSANDSAKTVDSTEKGKSEDSETGRSEPRIPRGKRGGGFGERELARYEILVTLPEVFQSARRLLKHGGRFFVVCKAERVTDLLSGLRAEGLEPKTLLPIQPKPSSDVDTVVVKAVKGGKPPLKFLKPFVVYDETGNMTEETRRIYHK